MFVHFSPGRRDGHDGGQRQDSRHPHHRKGERGQRERVGLHETTENDSSANIDERRITGKPEAEHKASSERQRDSFPPDGGLEHRAEHGAPHREKQQRDEEGWHRNRGERHAPSERGERGHPPGERGERGHPPGERGERGHPPGERGERGHPPGERGERGHPPGERGERGHPPGERGERGHPPGERGERGHPPGERGERGHPAGERGRGGQRRGGEKDYYGGRGPPPPGERHERGGAKDRDRVGKDGPARERKTSAPHDGEERSGGRGGRRQPPSTRDSNDNRGAPRTSRGGPPLLPNPPPPLFPPTDAVQHQLLPTPIHHDNRSHAHQLPSKKPTSDREVKGRGGLGYGELIDIESGEDWDNDIESGVGGARTRKGEQHGETEREHGHRRGGGGELGQKGGRPNRSSRDDSRAHQNQRGREERAPRDDRRQREDGEGGGGRRDGRRGGKGRGGEDVPPRHSGQRKPPAHTERRFEDSESELTRA